MKKMFSILFILLFQQILAAQPIRPTMGDFIGVNADAKEDWHRMNKFKSIREFHSWSSDIGYAQPKALHVEIPGFTESLINVPNTPANEMLNPDLNMDGMLSGIELYAFDTDGNGEVVYADYQQWDTNNDGEIKNIYNDVCDHIEIEDYIKRVPEVGEIGTSYKNSWTPSQDGSVLIDYDAFYARFKNRVHPVYRGIAPQLIGQRDYKNYTSNCADIDELKPFTRSSFQNCIDINDYPCPSQTLSFLGNYASIFPPPTATPLVLDQEDPFSYHDHTKWVTSSAIRYGEVADPSLFSQYSNYVSTATVLGLQSTYKTGLNHFNYVEVQNEPEKVWRDGEDAMVTELANVIGYETNGNPIIDGDNDAGRTFYQFKPNQFAAMLSAAYDGHGGTMLLNGSTTKMGIKPLVPLGLAKEPLKVIMGGMFDFHGAYIEKIMKWSELNRVNGSEGFISDKILPFDVINFHHYSTRFEDQLLLWGGSYDFYKDVYSHYYKSKIGRGGKSPEQDKIKELLSRTIDQLTNATYNDDTFDPESTLEQLTSVVHTFDPAVINEIKQKEIWLTEFGYDTGEDLYNGPGIVPISAAQTPYEADFVQIPDYYENNIANTFLDFSDRLDVQAQWIVRSYLEYSAVSFEGMHVQKAHMFEMSDKTPKIGGGNGAYLNSGLLFNDHTPKPSWYHVLTLKNVLNDYIFDEDLSATLGIIPNNNSAFRVYRYKHKNTIGELPDNNNDISANKYTYVIWSPSFKGFNLDAVENFNLNLSSLIGNWGTNANLKARIIKSNNLEEDGIKTHATVANGLISSFPITEQPIFIQTTYDGVPLEVDPIATFTGVSNLTARKLCCGQVELNWSYVSPVYCSDLTYQVYFVTTDGNGNDGVSSISDLIAKGTLFSDQVNKNYCAVAHNLLLPFNQYKFYVVPVIRKYNFCKLSIKMGAKDTYVPEWGAIAASSIVFTPVLTYTMPYIQITPGMIQVAPEVEANAVAMDIINEVFLPIEDETCIFIDRPGSVQKYLGSLFFEPSLANVSKAVTISFATPKLLKSIAIDDPSGYGRLKVDVLLCGREDRPECWTQVAVLNMNGYYNDLLYSENSNQAYFQYLTTQLPQRGVSKLRFIPLDEQANTAFIRICGEDIACNRSLPYEFKDQAIGSWVDHITESSAVVEWANEVSKMPQHEFVTEQEIVVGEKVDRDGNVIGGIRQKLDRAGTYATHLHTIDNLLPGTQYHYNIRYTFSFHPCDLVTPIRVPRELVAKGNFWTLGTQPNAQQPLVKKQKEDIVVYPNPAKDVLTVDFKGDQYARIEFVRGDGWKLYSEKVKVDASQHVFDTSALAQGWYIIRAVRLSGETVVRTVMIAR